jgi:hypothetical protein
MNNSENRQIFTLTSVPLINNNIPIGNPVSILNGLNAVDYAALLSASAKAKEQPLVSIEFKEILDIRAASLYIATQKNINIMNSIDSIFFDNTSLKTLLTSSSNIIFNSYKNKTCLCFINGNYANGIIFKKNENYYILTSNSINVGNNNNYIDILVNGTHLLCCSIFGIDKMSNLLIAMLNIIQSTNKYYQSSVNVYNIINAISYFNLNSSYDQIFNDNVDNGFDLFIVNHNLYNSPSIDKSLMINNRYYGDINNKATIESILVNHRINKYEAGSLILDVDGKIVGCLTAAALSADNTVDKNISIGLPSRFINNFINTHISNLNTFWDITQTVAVNTQLLWSDINRVIKKAFLGISCHPFSISSQELVDIYKLTNNISGIFIDGFMRYYNNREYKVSFNENYVTDNSDDSQIIFNPMIYGNELPYDNTDPILYKYNIEPNKILILRITFYSIVMGDVITINIGKLANQFSISKFLYEYGADKSGNYRDIIITYIRKDKVEVGYDNSGNIIYSWKWFTNNGQLYNETIKSKLVAYYQSDGINSQKIILLANKTLPKTIIDRNLNVYNYNNKNYDLSTYTKIGINARFPINDVINDTPILMKFIIVYIISDVSGNLFLEKYNTNESIQQAYVPSYGYKRYEFSIENCLTFKLYYQNGAIAQSMFKMETIIANDLGVILQQTTQIPFPLIQKNAENFGQYIYSNYSSNQLRNINSENYIL